MICDPRQLRDMHVKTAQPQEACVQAFYTLNSLWNPPTKSTCWHGRHGSGLTPRATHTSAFVSKISSLFLHLCCQALSENRHNCCLLKEIHLKKKKRKKNMEGISLRRT